jgi:hypothetical protein
MRLVEEDVQQLVLGGSPFEFEGTSDLGQEIILVSKPLTAARVSPPVSTEQSAGRDVVRHSDTSEALILE